MTGEDPAGEGGDEAEANGDTEETDIDSAKAERELEQGADRRKPALFDLIRQTLPDDPRNYAISPVLAQHSEAVFKGQGVSDSGGLPGVVGHFLVSLQHFLDSLGADVVMKLLDFSASVTVRLEPVVPPAAVEAARRLATETPKGCCGEPTFKT